MDVKICGLTNIDDARWALEAGADYLGFVLYSKSPRCVTIPELRRIADGLPETARLVGVFVNEAPILIKQVVEACQLTAVQLHGDEDPGEYLDLHVPVWRAVRYQDRIWTPDPSAWSTDRFVMDAASPAYGGTGMTVDWNAAADFAAHHPAMLAGGLDPDTVADAIRSVRPMGVDVSSGVEIKPGMKDLKKVAAFIEAVRDVEEALMNEEEA